MMKSEMEEIIECFHDGTISSIRKDASDVLFQIEIQYLANVLNTDYNSFYLRLNSCTCLELLNWDDDKIITDSSKIEILEPEILSCHESEDETVKVCCVLNEGPGGELRIEANDIEIYTEEMKPISLAEIEVLCNKYWSKFGEDDGTNRLGL